MQPLLNGDVVISKANKSARSVLVSPLSAVWLQSRGLGDKDKESETG